MKRALLSVRLAFAVFAFFASHNSLAVWNGEWCEMDSYVDYAPSGVPDFDQRSGAWGKVPGIEDPGHPDNTPDNPNWQWTWDGPVAWANALWWMDSRFERYITFSAWAYPKPIPPPAISDNFALLTSAEPTSFDDHDARNVPSLVAALARQFRADGDPWCSWSGIQVADAVSGLQAWLDQANLSKSCHYSSDLLRPYLVVGQRQYPAFYEIAHDVRRCQAAVLVLGLYEENAQVPGEYHRFGGHYVAVAAVNGVGKQLRVCDSILDVANPGAEDHTEVKNVSHDQYKAQDLRPRGCALVDYPWTSRDPGDVSWETLAKNFNGVNPAGLSETFLADAGMGRLTLVEHMIYTSPEWDDDLCKKSPYTDYAPAGVPDFDQRQDSWGKVPGAISPDDPDNNPQNPAWRWTWCGPVALASSLWWMDSRIEEFVCEEQEGHKPSPPPRVRWDHFSLLSAYGAWDDHDARNVGPFVSDLAARINVDGDPWCSWLGTRPEDLRDAAIGYLGERGLHIEGGNHPEEIYFEVRLTPEPTFDQVAREVYRCEDVVLLLGFYELTPEGKYVRVGGHYVTCAGVDHRGGRIVLSDPMVDATLPPIPQTPETHNDAAIVSHDEYRVSTLSDGSFWLTDYPWSLGPQHWLFSLLGENFDGANPSELPPPEIVRVGDYITKAEYMLHISPNLWYWQRGHDDYAPAGMVDIDQKQYNWGKVPGIGYRDHPDNNPLNQGWGWSHCVTVSWANALWWLDSQFETYFTPAGQSPVQPPAISDHFPLVTAYSPKWDDHDPKNVRPLVGDLEKRMKTGGDPWCSWTGTSLADAVSGAASYLWDRKLASNNTTFGFWLESGSVSGFMADQLKEIGVRLRLGQAVIPRLGFYLSGTRVDGHEVTVAGINERERLIAFSDPFWNTTEADNWPSGPGRFGIAHDPEWHATGEHNDAAFVSYDISHVGVLSDGRAFLENFWLPRYYEEAGVSFTGVNVTEEEIKPLSLTPEEIQQVGDAVAILETLGYLRPVGKLTATANVSPQHVAPGETITFDGTASEQTNPLRSIVKYEWDFDGDGTYDASGPTVTYAYGAYGAYHGSLRVADDDVPPKTAESFFDVFVEARPQITVIGKTGETLSLSWGSFGGGQYTVQWTDDPASGAWQNAIGAWPITETAWPGEDITGITRRYYRIMSQ